MASPRLVMVFMTITMMSMSMLDMHPEELIRIYQVQRQELKKTFVAIKGDD